jgi:hypothetical protein
MLWVVERNIVHDETASSEAAAGTLRRLWSIHSVDRKYSSEHNVLEGKFSRSIIRLRLHEKPTSHSW